MHCPKIIKPIALVKNCLGLFALFLLLGFSSCLSNKRLAYFQHTKDSVFNIPANNAQPLIQKGDMLYVGVSGADPQNAAIFNSASTLGSAGLSGTVPGLEVSPEGQISLPRLGKITAAGKTTRGLSEEIAQLLLPYVKDPIVTVRFMNFRISVLGEVNRPGNINISNERVNLLEAIALAGDLSANGKRKNVLLIREVNGKQQMHRLNLSDNSIFSSPYFYLQSNDVLYVEPNLAKSYSGTNTAVIMPILFSTISILVLVLNRL